MAVRLLWGGGTGDQPPGPRSIWTKMMGAPPNGRSGAAPRNGAMRGASAGAGARGSGGRAHSAGSGAWARTFSGLIIHSRPLSIAFQ
jgi:hypothetical protein